MRMAQGWEQAADQPADNFVAKPRRYLMKQAPIPAAVADQGRIRTGAGIRTMPAPLAAAPRIRTGAGIRIRPAAR
jgi:hypothetical protein